MIKPNFYKTIVIDAKNRNVYEKECCSLENLQEVVEGYIELACHFPNGDILYVNEEGRLKGIDYFFIIEGGNQPYAGNGVITGSRGPDANSYKSKIETIRKQVKFLDRRSK